VRKRRQAWGAVHHQRRAHRQAYVKWNTKHMPYVELEGYAQKVASEMCTITVPQLCKEINIL